MMLKQTPGKLGLALLVCLVFGGCASTAAAQTQASGTSSTLYKRLGGYDAIAAVTDDFIGRLAADSSSRVSWSALAPIRKRNSASTWSISYARLWVGPVFTSVAV